MSRFGFGLDRRRGSNTFNTWSAQSGTTAWSISGPQFSQGYLTVPAAMRPMRNMRMMICRATPLPGYILQKRPGIFIEVFRHLHFGLPRPLIAVGAQFDVAGCANFPAILAVDYRHLVIPPWLSIFS
jgi:hypothetical protein